MNIVGTFASEAAAAASSAIEAGGRALDTLGRATSAQRAVLLAEPTPARDVAPSLGRSLLVTRANGSRVLVTEGGTTIPVGTVALVAGLALLALFMGGR